MVLTGFSSLSEFHQFKTFTGRKLDAKHFSMNRGQFRIKFIGKTRKDSFVTVYLQCFIQKEQTRINSGIRIEKKYWDNKNREVKKSHAESEDLNLFLGQLRAKANKIAVAYGALTLLREGSI